MREDPAVLGGPPTVTLLPPHDLWPPPPYREEVAEAVAGYIRGGGPSSIADGSGPVGELEAAFRELTGQPYALSYCSGTAAMLGAMAAAGVEPGDEVIAPTHAFHAAATPALLRGARLVLVDSEPDSLNVDPARVAAAITPRTRAVVVVHTWGHPADLDPIVAVTRARDITLIEDCSHAHGASYQGQPIGSLGDVAIWSVHEDKLVAAGEGGVLVARSRMAYERALVQGHYRGRLRRELLPASRYRDLGETGWGLKLRMHPWAAVAALVYLRHLEEVLQRRGAILDVLCERLAGLPGIRPPVRKAYATMHAFLGCRLAYHPEELAGLPIAMFVQALQAEGLQVHRSTFQPLHRMALLTTPELGPFGRHGTQPPGWRPEDFPNAEHHTGHTLSLPTFWHPEGRRLAEEYCGAIAKISAYYAAVPRSQPQGAA